MTAKVDHFDVDGFDHLDAEFLDQVFNRQEDHHAPTDVTFDAEAPLPLNYLPANNVTRLDSTMVSDDSSVSSHSVDALLLADTTPLPAFPRRRRRRQDRPSRSSRKRARRHHHSAQHQSHKGERTHSTNANVSNVGHSPMTRNSTRQDKDKRVISSTKKTETTNPSSSGPPPPAAHFMPPPPHHLFPIMFVPPPPPMNHGPYSGMLRNAQLPPSFCNHPAAAAVPPFAVRPYSVATPPTTDTFVATATTTAAVKLEVPAQKENKVGPYSNLVKNSSFSAKVQLPSWVNPSDVLTGDSVMGLSVFSSYAGNKQYRNKIHSLMNLYRDTQTVKERRMIANWVYTWVTESGGRFLRTDSTTCEWVQLTQAQAMKKIMNYYQLLLSKLHKNV